jgi:hypothetical protein
MVNPGSTNASPSPSLDEALENLPSILDRLFPIPPRFQARLPGDLAELSRLFTSGRGERGGGYLGRAEFRSAYLRYFLPWNLYRMGKLLPALPLPLKDGDVVTDLGSGPLTAAIALWLCRPELRRLSLEFRCVDNSAAILNAGNSLFRAVAGLSGWKIHLVHAALGEKLRGERAAMVIASNVFNETGGLSLWSNPVSIRRAAGLLLSIVREKGAILVTEPGIPQGGAFISRLRSNLMEGGFFPAAPCTHKQACPLLASRGKWCHFVYDAAGAPKWLLRLSAQAGLPKTRAVFSYLYAEGSPPEPQALEGFPSQERARLISDPFLVEDGRPARYGCAPSGLVLVLDDGRTESGEQVLVVYQRRRDRKTGAPVAGIVREVRRE